MSNSNYIEKVGAFLDNELDGDELVRFNEDLAQNPALVEELNFQKELIEGIKNNRRTELKARLDNVQIGNGFWSGTAVKLVSGVVIVAGIGYGIFELSNSPDSPDSNEMQTTEVTSLDQDTSSEVPEQTPEAYMFA